MTFDLARADWGAAAPNGRYQTIAMKDRPGGEGHHSVGVYGASTPSAFAKAVQKDHLARRWTDIFYNVLFWADGTIIEGRPWHATSGSVRRLTMCLGGNFDVGKMTAEMQLAVTRAWQAGVDKGMPTSVGWHGQRAATACPGRNSIPFWQNLPSGVITTQNLGDRVLRLLDPFMHGPDVKEWQQMLNAVRSAIGSLHLTEDGVFGPATAEASALFMRVRMNVQTDDPRVGPRTIEEMRIQLNKITDPDADVREPDFVVAGLAGHDVDEGAARVLCARNGWRFLRYPEQALDHTIGTAILVGGRAARADMGRTWQDERVLRGADRVETTRMVAQYMTKPATTRTAPAV